MKRRRRKYRLSLESRNRLAERMRQYHLKKGNRVRTCHAQTAADVEIDNDFRTVKIGDVLIKVSNQISEVVVSGKTVTIK